MERFMSISLADFLIICILPLKASSMVFKFLFHAVASLVNCFKAFSISSLLAWLAIFSIWSSSLAVHLVENRSLLIACITFLTPSLVASILISVPSGRFSRVVLISSMALLVLLFILLAVASFSLSASASKAMSFLW